MQCNTQWLIAAEVHGTSCGSPPFWRLYGRVIEQKLCDAKRFELEAGRSVCVGFYTRPSDHEPKNELALR